MSSRCPEPARDGITRIIAHRGASGYLPEHTAVAKALAYGLGADFLEQDLVATKDHQLVVLHDLHLNDISNVAECFPDRRREDGRHYAVDFTLEELARLSVHERRKSGTGELMFGGRFPLELQSLRIPSFTEEIGLVAGLNATTGRRVGIYPEIKEPDWHEAAGIDLTRLVYETLEAQRPLLTGPVFVQSFSTTALKRLKSEFRCEWPLVQLLDRDEARALQSDAAAIAGIADYATAIGCPAELLLERSGIDESLRPTRLARTLAGQKMALHPYTMRRDQPLAEGVEYFEALRFLIHELEVEALFCDQPDHALSIRDCSEV